MRDHLELTHRQSSGYNETTLFNCCKAEMAVSVDDVCCLKAVAHHVLTRLSDRPARFSIAYEMCTD